MGGISSRRVGVSRRHNRGTGLDTYSAPTPFSLISRIVHPFLFPLLSCILLPMIPTSELNHQMQWSVTAAINATTHKEGYSPNGSCTIITCSAYPHYLLPSYSSTPPSLSSRHLMNSSQFTCVYLCQYLNCVTQFTPNNDYDGGGGGEERMNEVSRMTK